MPKGKGILGKPVTTVRPKKGTDDAVMVRGLSAIERNKNKRFFKPEGSEFELIYGNTPNKPKKAPRGR